MNRPAVLASSVLAVGALVAPSACSDAGATREAPRVSVVTDLVVPRSVLDRATALSLRVVEGEATCDEETSTATLADDPAKVRTVVERELDTAGCATGVRFCGDVPVERSTTPRVFLATARAGDRPIAVGCTTATVDQPELAIRIRMVRYLDPAVCGDGTIQPTEQCEPGGTATCDDTCQTNEILLSVGASANGTQTGNPGDKSDPFALWPEGTGAAGRFVVFFTDRAVANRDADVGLRVMGDDFTPVSTPPALAAGSIFLPNGATFPPPPTTRNQSRPAAAFLGGKYFVAFEDDNTPAANGLDIHLRSMDGSLVADQAAQPIGVNGPAGAGEPNAQAAPALAAGPRGRLFVAWEDQAQGKIVGRTLTPPDALGSQNDLSIGTGNSAVSIAATPTGWVAVWQSGTGIKLRVVNEDGTPQGGDQNVGEGAAAERPRVASLGDGRFAVAFTAGGDVFVQRYDARGVKIAGDQDAPINDAARDDAQSDVAIASTPAAGGSYVVAWLDQASGHVRARMLGGTSGFLFNPVDGQATAFQASRTDGRTRKRPAVVSGGSGPFVVIAWEDATAPGAGIVGRRFPLPAE